MSFYGDEPVAYAGFGRGTPRHDIELRKTTFMVTKFIVAVITAEPGHVDTVEQELEVAVAALRREPVRPLRWSIWPGLFYVSATAGKPAFRRVASTQVVGIGIRSNF
jgi:hypothetical protein